MEQPFFCIGQFAIAHLVRPDWPLITNIPANRTY